MELRNSLYKIITLERNGQSYRFEVELDSNHVIYHAHFPSEPITPGVCIVQICIELFEELLNTKLTLASIKNVKFLSVISPVETPRIDFYFDIIETNTLDIVKAQVTVKKDNASLSKVSFTCRKNING